MGAQPLLFSAPPAYHIYFSHSPPPTSILFSVYDVQKYNEVCQSQTSFTCRGDIPITVAYLTPSGLRQNATLLLGTNLLHFGHRQVQGDLMGKLYIPFPSFRVLQSGRETER